MQFNGVNIDFVIAKKGREFLPSVANITIDPPTMVGSHYVRDKIGMRVIPVDVTVLADSRLEFNQKVRQLAQILYTEEPKILKFDDDDVIYYAKLSGSTPINELADHGTLSIDFECYDPHKYAIEESVTSNASLQNYGRPTPFRASIEITSDVQFFKLEIGGNYLMFNFPFMAGDAIEIDTKFRTAELNTLDLRKYRTLFSTWLEIPTGESEIIVDNGSLIQITYRKRWL